MFADNAARLCGICCALLYWRPDEFWSATPADIASVVAALAPSADAPGDGELISKLKEQFPDG